MKNRILTLIIISFFTVTGVSGQTVKKSQSAGTWKFDAPYAPEGYSSGTIVIGSAEKKDTATMSFGTGEYKLGGENVKFVNDSVMFSIFLEGQDIKVMLKVNNDTLMSGKAVYSEGEVPLTLTKADLTKPKTN
jgi:hypothetical protein